MTASNKELSSAQGTAWLAQAWARRLGEAYETTTGQKFELTTLEALNPSRLETATADATWWEQPFSSPLDATLLLAASVKTSVAVGQRALESAGVTGATPDESQSMYREFIRQSLDAVAVDLGSRLGSEVLCLSGWDASAPAGRPGFRLQMKDPEGALTVEFGLVVSPALESALDGVKEIPAPGAKAELPSPAPDASAAADGQTSIPPTMDLVLDVELPVSISFGRTSLLVKEVLKLTSGSIVELNRSVNEPVDIVVNNCVIARGEVVVVDGNYGVRISQIISRQERLRNFT